MARDCTSWFVRRVRGSFILQFMMLTCTKGDTLLDDKAIEYEFYRIVPLTSNLIVEDEIYECFTNEAPDNLTGIYQFLESWGTDADRITKENCKVLGVLKTNLSGVEKWRLDKVTGQNGKDCYRIDYTLLAKFGSADIHVSFKMKGKYPSGELRELFYANC